MGIAMPKHVRGSLALRGILASATVAAAAAAAAPAVAQPLDAKYWAEASAYFPSIDTEVNIARPGMPGTDVDVESDLNLDKNETLGAAALGARFADRWVVVGEFYALDRTGSRTLGRDLTIDGAVYPVGATLDSKLQSDVYRVTVGYTFLRNESGELGAAIGLHATDFEFQVEGQARATGNTLFNTTRRREFLAPLPTLGLYGTYEPMPNVVLNGRVDYLSLKVGDYDGGILNVQASVAYRVTEGIELGAAYRFVSYDLDIDKDNYSARIDYDFSGPSVFLRFSFR